MNSILLKKVYYESCLEELEAFKPGNHSIFSRIPEMNELKFKYAAKLSSEYLIDKNLSLGESIHGAVKTCQTSLNSNYNLGIIILCAPIIKVFQKSVNKPRSALRNLLINISKRDGQLILNAIEIAKPAGIKIYKGKGNIFKKNNLSFRDIMKIGSKHDRISNCYFSNYNEIFDFGLPLLDFLKKRISRIKAIEILYINFLCTALDSHILRKFGAKKAKIVKYKALMLNKKIKIFHNNKTLFKEFDTYLKNSHINPGTCADLTVTTLLIHKIRDIFKFPL